MNPPRVIDRSKQKTLSGYHLTDDDDDSSYNSIKFLIIARTETEKKRRKKIHWSPSPISPDSVSPRKGRKGHPIHLVRHPFANHLFLPFNPPARNFSARRHGIRQCSHGRMQFKCRFRAGSSRGEVQRSGAEVVANCDPRTRPAGNGEELSRMDGSARLLAS